MKHNCQPEIKNMEDWWFLMGMLWGAAEHLLKYSEMPQEEHLCCYLAGMVWLWAELERLGIKNQSHVRL